MKANATIIVLAYPDNFVVIPDKWYKWAMRWTFLTSHGMFKGGHAALVLISDSGEIMYADFGRYMTEKGFGRARTLQTDPELNFEWTAIWKDNQLENVEELLKILDINSDRTHGNGTMYASLCEKVNFEAAKESILDHQSKGSIPYNPLGNHNSNCSKFVQKVLMQSVVDKKLVRKISRRKLISISPIGNVINANTGRGVFKIKNGGLKRDVGVSRIAFFFGFLQKCKSAPKQKEYFDSPFRNSMIPPSATWLGGTGAGAWFHIRQKGKEHYLISRYEENGLHIFTRLFEIDKEGFEVNGSYYFSYPCSAMSCKIIQKNQIYIFKALDDQTINSWNHLDTESILQARN